MSPDIARCPPGYKIAPVEDHHSKTVGRMWVKQVFLKHRNIIAHVWEPTVTIPKGKRLTMRQDYWWKAK